MPPVTRWYIRTSLVFLVLSLALGALLAARTPLNLPAATGVLTPIYFHLLFVGFVAQLIFGVVFWLFPKHTKENPRGSERLAWIAYWLLNAGLVLRLIAEPANDVSRRPFWGWLLVVSAAAQLAAGILFAANTWPRVKER
ncbi:MAG TPA: cbb3-type cytochrome c oxidase subunit I [Anaerolineales bacterium]|nr:cbb3-type cytochrome c oxidase subunit I [Anaerolineales bacterium]